MDNVSGQSRYIQLPKLSYSKRSETGGLHGILKIAIGARVMLTSNVDVSDGLVNGAMGMVVEIICDNDNKVKTIIVEFDNPSIGVECIQFSPYKSSFPHGVPIVKYEVQFYVMGKQGAEITRLQFPLILAWATTIHKVQGLTLDEIVFDMKGKHFSAGQAYVACSRVRTLQGLHILNFNLTAIRKSVKSSK